MQINEAKIFNFGKIQNQTLTFAPGFNVIYGENEAGKTTVHDFLTAMLFGMEKNKGRAAAGDCYLHYEPWHAASYYSGAIRFSVDGKPFYLERNFYHKEKKEILRNEMDGEELSVAYGDLRVLFGGIEKEAFGNTYDIPQSGAATGRELAAVLAEYLSDASGSGEAGIQVTRAKEALTAKKRELSQELKHLKEQKNQQIHSLMIEKELLERDSRGLQGNIADAEREINQLKREQKRELGKEQSAVQEMQHEQETTQAGRDIRAVAMMVAACLMTVVNALVYHKHPYPAAAFLGIELFLVLMIVLLAVQVKKTLIKRGKVSGKTVEERQTQGPVAMYTNYATAALSQSERMLKNLRESFAEKETRRYNIIQEMESLRQPGEYERELLTDIEALDLASSEITRLAGEICEDIWDELNGAVSGWTSMITQGKYDSVSVENDGKLKIHTDGRAVPPEALSRGTLEQIYLALRLAVGDIVTKEEEMPLFFDEAFALYDDRRLRQTLQALSKRKGQIFIFTCQKREMQLLESLGISYYKKEL